MHLARTIKFPFAALLFCALQFSHAADLTTASLSGAPLAKPPLASMPAYAVSDNNLGPNDLSLDGLTVDEVDLWVRIRKGYAIPDLDNQLVTNQTAWYAARPGIYPAHHDTRIALPVPRGG